MKRFSQIVLERSRLDKKHDLKRQAGQGEKDEKRKKLNAYIIGRKDTISHYFLLGFTVIQWITGGLLSGLFERFNCFFCGFNSRRWKSVGF